MPPVDAGVEQPAGELDWALATGVGLLHQAGQLGDPSSAAGPDRLFQGVEDQGLLMLVAVRQPRMRRE